MFIHNGRKIIFLAIPKTGTRSVYQWMESIGGRRLHDHSHCIPGNIKHFSRFSIIRNPYSRAVSFYRSLSSMPERKKRGRRDIPDISSIELFLEDYSISPRHTAGKKQSLYLRQGIDYILRFESLGSDFAALPFVRSGEEDLPEINTSREKDGSSNHFVEFLSDNAIKTINQFYAEDFERTGYRKVESIDELRELYS